MKMPAGNRLAAIRPGRALIKRNPMAKIAPDYEGYNTLPGYSSVFGPPALAIRPRRRDRTGELVEDDEPIRQAPKDPRKRILYHLAYTLALTNPDQYETILDGFEDGLEDARHLMREGLK